MALTHIELIATAEEKMGKTLKVLESDLATLKVGRANPSLLNRITVDYYGTQTPISQVGNISAPEPRLLTITLWEQSMVKVVEKAIQKSDLGINPVSDGKVIRLLIPELTEERRKELVKLVRKLGEDAKVAMRSIRRDTNDQLKKMEKKSEITEDDLKQDEKKVQDITDKNIAQVDSRCKAKEEEVMSV